MIQDDTKGRHLSAFGQHSCFRIEFLWDVSVLCISVCAAISQSLKPLHTYRLVGILFSTYKYFEALGIVY